MIKPLQDPIVLRVGDFVELQLCPACGSAEKSILSTRTAFSLIGSFPKGMVALHRDVEERRRLYRCGICGLRYLSHIPKREVLESLLDSDGILGLWPQHDRPAFRRGREALRMMQPNGTVIIDIGAHTGGFLSTLPPQWEKHALEPMASSSSRIEGTEVHRGYLEDAELPESAFDCISAFDVVEHLRDPNTALASISRALKPGGMVLIETGNAESLGARLLGAGWYYLNYLEHFHAFSEQSLKLLLLRHEFRDISCSRVFHEKTMPLQAGRVALVTALYGVLTLGRQPVVWRQFLRRLRPCHTGSPPITGALEPDHLFMIGMK
jgi:hypothetical protein